MLPVKNDPSQKWVAVIREAECIGCTKCIQACPVDAILGASKYMHTVIQDECIGCELCIAPCPVDCIEMVAVMDAEKSAEKRDYIKNRVQARKKRLSSHAADPKTQGITEKQNYLQAALARVKLKKRSH